MTKLLEKLKRNCQPGRRFQGQLIKAVRLKMKLVPQLTKPGMPTKEEKLKLMMVKIIARNCQIQEGEMRNIAEIRAGKEEDPEVEAETEIEEAQNILTEVEIVVGIQTEGGGGHQIDELEEIARKTILVKGEDPEVKIQKHLEQNHLNQEKVKNLRLKEPLKKLLKIRQM